MFPLVSSLSFHKIHIETVVRLYRIEEGSIYRKVTCVLKKLRDGKEWWQRVGKQKSRELNKDDVYETKKEKITDTEG